MASRKPTHRVRHKNGWEVEIYIATTLWQRLLSRNEEVRQRARTSVAIRVRTALGKKFPRFPVGAWLEWGDFSLVVIEPMVAFAHSPEQPLAEQPAAEKHCCSYFHEEACTNCDIGNHGFCDFGCNLWG